MKVICAGLSKTGTKSLASALRILGYNVHDLFEHWTFHMDEYTKALESNEMPDFAYMYDDVDAVIAAPAFYFFEEISQAFPDAKIVLTVRDDEEVWLKSLLKTLEVWKLTYSQWWIILGISFTHLGRKFKRLIETSEKKIYGNFKDHEEFLKGIYRKHNERVLSVVPRDKLLVYNVKQGWKPLCEFLGVEVPGEPFPRLNINSELIPDMLNSSDIGRKIFRELILILAVLVLLLAILVYIVFIN